MSIVCVLSAGLLEVLRVNAVPAVRERIELLTATTPAAFKAQHLAQLCGACCAVRALDEGLVASAMSWGERGLAGGEWAGIGVRWVAGWLGGGLLKLNRDRFLKVILHFEAFFEIYKIM